MAVVLGGLGCSVGPTESPGTPLAERGEGYVSSDACQACHPGEHASWHRSYHRQMTMLATPDAVKGRFDGSVLRFDGHEYRLSESDGAYYVSTDGGEPRRIVMTTGSHHFQGYWFESGEGRELEMFRMMWVVAEQRWRPFQNLVLTPPNFPQIVRGGEWNELCIACHTTNGKPLVGPDMPTDTRVAEFGIACESCHGPGEEHTKANQNPVRRLALRLGDGHDETIVNPARLEPIRSTQICGQCHAIQFIADPERWKREGFRYRPGEDLFETRIQSVSDRPGGRETRFWSDGRVRTGGREYPGIVESACFASGELTCLSCHRLHQDPGDPRPAELWADDQLEVGMRGDAACVGCHAELADATAQAAHSHHAAGSSGSLCQSCHMPHSAFGLHKATRTHHIASPTAAETAQTGRPNACNLCHLDRTLAWTADRLAEWYGTPRPELGERERSVAAGVWWILAGNANQRALAGWHLGYEPSQRAAGTDWMAPYLAHLLRDPYEVNRSVAVKSLARLPGYEDIEVDYMDWPAGVDRVARQVQTRWLRLSSGGTSAARPELLLGAGGELDVQAAVQIADERDRRPIYLAE